MSQKVGHACVCPCARLGVWECARLHRRATGILYVPVCATPVCGSLCAPVSPCVRLCARVCPWILECAPRLRAHVCVRVYSYVPARASVCPGTTMCAAYTRVCPTPACSCVGSCMPMCSHMRPPAPVYIHMCPSPALLVCAHVCTCEWPSAHECTGLCGGAWCTCHAFQMEHTE